MLDRDQIREHAAVLCDGMFPTAKAGVAAAELLANAMICLSQIAITAHYAHANMVAMEQRTGDA